MEYANIIYTVDNGIATIKLNRPKALNALNSEINADIMAAINEVKADPSVRVLIMTGSERAFAAGADVKEMAEAPPRYAREFCGLAIEINNILESLPIPTIAAVGGFAFGGGCEMTLACDFRVGGSRTTLSFPEVGHPRRKRLRSCNRNRRPRKGKAAGHAHRDGSRQAGL